MQFSYTGSWDPASKVKPVNVLSHNELHLKMKMTDETMTWKDAFELFKFYRSLAGDNAKDVKIVDITQET